MKLERSRTFYGWLLLTFLLGCGFLVSQLIAWRQLVVQGIYLSSNPYSSFFYLFTGTHGAHLLGGIVALAFLLLRVSRQRREENPELKIKHQAAVDTVALYWHFMDGLWIGLLLLLLLWQ